MEEEGPGPGVGSAAEPCGGFWKVQMESSFHLKGSGSGLGSCPCSRCRADPQMRSPLRVGVLTLYKVSFRRPKKRLAFHTNSVSSISACF